MYAPMFLCANPIVDMRTLRLTGTKALPTLQLLTSAALEDQTHFFTPSLQSPEELERRMVFRLYEVMRGCDMTVTSEKMLRNQLAQELKIEDMKQYKALLKQHILYFVENIDDKDTLQPMGHEDPGKAPAQQPSKFKPPQVGDPALAYSFSDLHLLVHTLPIECTVTFSASWLRALCRQVF